MPKTYVRKDYMNLLRLYEKYSNYLGSEEDAYNNLKTHFSDVCSFGDITINFIIDNMHYYGFPKDFMPEDYRFIPYIEDELQSLLNGQNPDPWHAD